MGPGREGCDQRREIRVDIALALLVLTLTAPIMQTLGFQQSSRMALTAAMWEQHEIEVDDYLVGNDRAEHAGHTYSDKAPGQPIWALPAYAIHDLAGGASYASPALDRNTGLWATSIWSATLPAALLAVVVRRVCRRYDTGVATLVAVAVSVGTLLLPFSSLLFGHVLSTLFAFSGWALATRARPSARTLALAGVLLAAAVAVDYTMVFAAIAVAGYLAIRAWRMVVPLIAGAVPIGLLLAWYQLAAFGDLFTISYARSTYVETAEQIGLPDSDLPLVPSAVRVLFGERGLFLVTPVMAVALAGTIVLIWRLRGTDRLAIVAAALTAVALVCVQIGWSNPTGGDSPGPRYASAAAAFLAPGLTIGWRRWPLAAWVTGIIGTVFMVAATWTNPLTARRTSGAFRKWLADLLGGDVAETVYGPTLGRFSWLVAIGCVAAAAWWLLRCERDAQLHRTSDDGGRAPINPPREARA